MCVCVGAGGGGVILIRKVINVMVYVKPGENDTTELQETR